MKWVKCYACPGSSGVMPPCEVACETCSGTGKVYVNQRTFDTIENGGKADCRDCVYLERACAEHGGGDDDKPTDPVDPREKSIKVLVAAAHDVLKDERHWSVTDVVDRADSAADLANMILMFLGVEDEECPEDCDECAQHSENIEP